MATDDPTQERPPRPIRPDTASTPSSSSPQAQGEPVSQPTLQRRLGQRILDDISADMKQRIAARRVETERARAAFTGDCFECKDTGYVDEPYTGRKACPRCARGEEYTKQMLALARAQRLAGFLAHGGIPVRRRTQ